MNTTKQLVKDFYFPEPNWSNLPTDFPYLSKKGLTKQESHLLDGIKLAWQASEGRDFYLKETAKRTLIGMVIVSIVLTGSILLIKPGSSLAKNVNAKTVTSAVGNIVEATVSAVFK